MLQHRPLGRGQKPRAALAQPAAFSRLVQLDDAAVPPTQPLVVPLTDRELEVVRLLAQGRSNREIAAALFLAEGKVKNHVTNVLAKLEARDAGRAPRPRPRAVVTAGSRPNRDRRS